MNKFFLHMTSSCHFNIFLQPTVLRCADTSICNALLCSFLYRLVYCNAIQRFMTLARNANSRMQDGTIRFHRPLLKCGDAGVKGGRGAQPSSWIMVAIRYPASTFSVLCQRLGVAHCAGWIRGTQEGKKRGGGDPGEPTSHCQPNPTPPSTQQPTTTTIRCLPISNGNRTPGGYV